MMDLETFIEWIEQADPASAQMVRDGYCSWEDLGYDGPDAHPDYIDDAYEREQEAYDYAMYEEHRHEQ